MKKPNVSAETTQFLLDTIQTALSDMQHARRGFCVIRALHYALSATTAALSVAMVLNSQWLPTAILVACTTMMVLDTKLLTDEIQQLDEDLLTLAQDESKCQQHLDETQGAKS